MNETAHINNLLNWIDYQLRSSLKTPDEKWEMFICCVLEYFLKKEVKWIHI